MILEIISKDNSQRLKEVLYTRVTRNQIFWIRLTIKIVEELLVFACYTGSLKSLLVLSKFGTLNLQNSPKFIMCIKREKKLQYSAES